MTVGCAQRQAYASRHLWVLWGSSQTSNRCWGSCHGSCRCIVRRCREWLCLESSASGVVFCHPHLPLERASALWHGPAVTAGPCAAWGVVCWCTHCLLVLLCLFFLQCCVCGLTWCVFVLHGSRLQFQAAASLRTLCVDVLAVVLQLLRVGGLLC